MVDDELVVGKVFMLGGAALQAVFPGGVLGGIVAGVSMAICFLNGHPLISGGKYQEQRINCLRS